MTVFFFMVATCAPLLIICSASCLGSSIVFCKIYIQYSFTGRQSINVLDHHDMIRSSMCCWSTGKLEQSFDKSAYRQVTGKLTG
jgi:hypothetical protein